MKLLTEEIKKKLPRLYSQDGKGDNAIVYIKFFCPWSSWTWWASEAEASFGDGTACDLKDIGDRQPEDIIFFGLVDGLEQELGYFSLNELESVTGPGGLKIERDMYFKPCTLAEVKKAIWERSQ